MRPDIVEVLQPRGDEDVGLGWAAEPFHVQAFETNSGPLSEQSQLGARLSDTSRDRTSKACLRASCFDDKSFPDLLIGNRQAIALLSIGAGAERDRLDRGGLVRQYGRRHCLNRFGQAAVEGRLGRCHFNSGTLNIALIGCPSQLGLLQCDPIPAAQFQSSRPSWTCSTLVSNP